MSAPICLWQTATCYWIGWTSWTQWNACCLSQSQSHFIPYIFFVLFLVVGSGVRLCRLISVYALSGYRHTARHSHTYVRVGHQRHEHIAAAAAFAVLVIVIIIIILCVFHFWPLKRFGVLVYAPFECTLYASRLCCCVRPLSMYALRSLWLMWFTECSTVNTISRICAIM